MTKKKKPDLAAVLQSTDEIPESTIEVVSDKPISRKIKRVSSTYYIPEEDHYRIKELALHRRCRVNDLVMEGLNMMLEKYGQEPIKNNK